VLLQIIFVVVVGQRRRLALGSSQLAWMMQATGYTMDHWFDDDDVMNAPQWTE